MAVPALPSAYAPIRMLGKGAYGEVWLCSHLATEKLVAVKILTDALAIERATIETDALRVHTGNANILQLLETIREDGRLYLVTEYAEGGDMLKLMQDRECRPLPEAEACRYFRQLVFALDAIHRSGWVHRDLKCENVLLSAAKDRVIIADFGFAARWSPTETLSEPFGSLHYSAPEIVAARPYTGPEVDVWSLGVVLYALCFGRLPFGGANENEIADRITQGAYILPSTASPALGTLLAMMLHPSAAERVRLDAIKRSTWLMSGAGADVPAPSPPLVLRSKTTGSAIQGRAPALGTRPRRSSMSSLAEGLFKRLTHAKLQGEEEAAAAAAAANPPPEGASKSAALAPNTAAEAATPQEAEGAVLTRLSRFTLNGVKRFSITRLLRGRAANAN